MNVKQAKINLLEEIVSATRKTTEDFTTYQDFKYDVGTSEGVVKIFQKAFMESAVKRDTLIHAYQVAFDEELPVTILDLERKLAYLECPF